MNKFLKTIALLAAVMMAFSAFTACGDKTNDQPQNQTDDSANTDDSGEQNAVQELIP